jgi:hypothetical protein
MLRYRLITYTGKGATEKKYHLDVYFFLFFIPVYVSVIREG